MLDSPIVLTDICKTFFDASGRPSVLAVEQINLKIPDHSFVSFLGPSGCGKTTLLRMIAGIEQPTTGTVWCKQKLVTKINTEVAYVPQGKGLFPWMSLRTNIEFPLRIARLPKDTVRARSREWIRKVGLDGFDDHYPWQLSGGMEKRGSLARALIADLDIILMDEPFGPLDAQTRLILQNDLLRLWSEKRSIVVFVTHDLVEAVALSDIIVIMTRRPGRIKKIVNVVIPRPRDVFEIFKEPHFDEVYDEVRDAMHDELVAGVSS
jgi:NitT/TauT family transport system ATP-binding protein